MASKKVKSGSIIRFLVNKKKEENKNDISDFVNQKIKSVIQNEQNEEAEEVIDTHDTQYVTAELETEKKKNQKLTEDLKKAVMLINEFNAINLNKDIEIVRLSKKVEAVSLECRNDQSLFSEFRNTFSEIQLKELRSVPSGISRDSTFVLKCMRFLYTDASVLLHISMTGKPFKQQKKEKMCEKNVDVIKKILNQRIASEEIDLINVSIRMRRLSKLIRDAIDTIRKSVRNSNRDNGKKNQYLEETPSNTNQTTNVNSSINAEAMHINNENKQQQLEQQCNVSGNDIMIPTPSAQPFLWNFQVGDHCLAKYWEDEKYYSAEIQIVSDKTYIVKYLGYDNFEEVLHIDCIPNVEF